MFFALCVVTPLTLHANMELNMAYDDDSITPSLFALVLTYYIQPSTPVLNQEENESGLWNSYRNQFYYHTCSAPYINKRRIEYYYIAMILSIKSEVYIERKIILESIFFFSVENIINKDEIEILFFSKKKKEKKRV